MRTRITTLLLAAVLLAGCSVRHLVIGRIGSAVAGGGTTFSADDDPDLVGDALPFTLKFIESLIAESPKDVNLLTAAARGFTQYTYGWVDLPDSPAAANGRATRLYLRARDYGLRALSASVPEFPSVIERNPELAIARAQKRDVPALYWTAASWALAIAGSKDDPELLADLPVVDAMIRRAAALDPDYDSGAIDSFLISYEASRSFISSDAGTAARKHFDRAVALSGGASASPYVAAAEAFAIPSQDRGEFESLLGKALAVDVDARPEWRLQNLLAQRRANWLLVHADELFVEQTSQGGAQ